MEACRLLSFVQGSFDLVDEWNRTFKLNRHLNKGGNSIFTYFTNYFKVHFVITQVIFVK